MRMRPRPESTDRSLCHVIPLLMEMRRGRVGEGICHMDVAVEPAGTHSRRPEWTRPLCIEIQPLFQLNVPRVA